MSGTTTGDDDGSPVLGEHPEAPDRGDVMATRGPAHPRRERSGRHRLRPAGEREAVRRLAACVPIHPETSPMTSSAEAAIVADRLLGDLEPDASSATADRLELDADRHRAPHTFWGFLREVAVIAVIAIVIAMLVKTFLVRPYYIPSASMDDTLRVNDRIIVNLLVPELVPVSRGDIVVFTDPGGWLPPVPLRDTTPAQMLVDGALEAVGLKPSDEHSTLIKRIIGLPGDRIVCCNAYGQLSINDVAIAEPYVELAGNRAVSGVPFDVTVPEGFVWVMGDNRYNSEDSRFHQDDRYGGFVPIANIIGTAMLINWPFDRVQLLGNHAEVFAQVPSREPQPSA